MRARCSGCLEEVEIGDPADTPGARVACSRCGAAIDPRRTETLPSSEQPELLPGLRAGDAIGGYVLERRLGRGGMGTVLLARQLSLGREVALKVLASELQADPDFVRRFDAEARALAQLAHPNIVRVIDKGTGGGRHFLVMELVDGVSLREVLDARRMTPAEALALVPQLCDALEYAHARGVIHRDVKPQNILIASDGTPKIADFGLARIVGATGAERITRSNVVMGTLDYMAPEQREKSKSADHRADIYALGVVIYEMLTGELPLGRFDPHSKKVKLEVDIDEVVLRVLAKDPEVRYQRASDVGSEIRRLLARESSPRRAPASSPATSRRGLVAAMLLGVPVMYAMLAANAMQFTDLPMGAGWVVSLLVTIFGGALLGAGARVYVLPALERIAWSAEGLPPAIAIAAAAGLFSLLLPWTKGSVERPGATPGIAFAEFPEVVVAAACVTMLMLLRARVGAVIAGTAALVSGLLVASVAALTLGTGVWIWVGAEGFKNEEFLSRSYGPDAALLAGMGLAIAGGALLLVAPPAPARPGEPAMRGIARLGLAVSACSVAAPIVVGLVSLITHNGVPLDFRGPENLRTVSRAALAAMIATALAGIVCSASGQTRSKSPIVGGEVGMSLGAVGLAVAVGVGALALQLR